MEQVHAAMAVTKNQRLGDETRKTSPTVGCRVRLGPWLLRMSLRQGHDAGELARNDSPWKNRTLWQSRSGLWRNLCLVNVATWIFWKASSWVKNLPWKAASVLCHRLFHYKILQVLCWTSEARKWWTWRFLSEVLDFCQFHWCHWQCLGDIFKQNMIGRSDLTCDQGLPNSWANSANLFSRFCTDFSQGTVARPALNFNRLHQTELLRVL